jgi:hypothetical protein
VKIRRWSIAGLVAASLLTPGLAACKIGGGQPDAASPAVSATPLDPAKQELIASTEEMRKGNFRFAVSGDGVTGGGVVHQPSRSAQISIKSDDPAASFSMDMDLIYLEPESWVKLDVGRIKGLPGMDQVSTGKYLHLDQSKTKDLKNLTFDFSTIDPAGAPVLTEAVVDVQKKGEGSYSGTIDLSKASEVMMVNPSTVTALGVQANRLPFAAKLDSQGRLTSLTIQVPATEKSKAQELKVSYSDYGVVTPPQKPAASETEEAPAEVYDLFK